MPSFRIPLAALILTTATGGAVFGTTAKTDPSPEEIQKIIKTFAANESAFARARENYTYRQSVKLQEFDGAGLPGGRFERVEDIVFDKEGKRLERVVRAPVASLRMVTMTAEDEQDLRNVLPFVLTSKEIDDYHVRYLGRQKVDEIDTYVFAVKPKTLTVGRRYFNGQIWVDDRDLMIVKSYGRAGGLLKVQGQQFPKFETYREQIEGKYWFPTFTTANSTLYFPDSVVRLRMTVKYDDYKQFKSDTKITFGDEVTDPGAKAPAAPEPGPTK